MKGFERIPIETKRDACGWASNLLDFLPLRTEELKNVHLVSLAPGAVRGNHRHKTQTEAICLLGGPVLVRAMDRATGEKHEENVAGDSPVMFVVSPGVSHAFQNRGGRVCFLACFTDTIYDFDHPDSETDELIVQEKEHAS